MDFANFRRIFKTDSLVYDNTLDQLNQVRVWRVDSDAESDAVTDDYGEVEYESESVSVSPSHSSNSDHSDCASVDDSDSSDHEVVDETMAHEVGLQSVGNCSEADSNEQEDDNDASNAIESPRTALWDDLPSVGQSFFKLVRARRAASRDWPTDRQYKRQLSDLSRVERGLKDVSMITIPLLNRQLTT